MKIEYMQRAARSALLGALALSATALFAGTLQPPGQQPPIPFGVTMKSWQDNGREGRYVLQLIKGQAPKRGKSVTGTVMSDTDCDADAQGLSHCNNIIKLADGSQVTVIDTHNMHRYRCLGPGDRLTLTTLGKSWMVGTLGPKVK